MDHAYVHVYTGDGKRKTTAALGLLLRARGAGLKVCLVQFIKSMEYHEVGMLKELGVPVRQFGRGCFIRGEPEEADRKLARDGLTYARRLLHRGDLDLLILDEVNVAIHLGLVDETEVLDLLPARPAGLELVCTGRGAPEALINAADLVTEMVNVKHYYDAGVPARDGIER